MRLPRFGLPATSAAVLGLCLFVGLPLLDYDYFWHNKTGEWIVEHGWSLPRTEPFSFTAAGSRLVVQGWLFDAIQYLAHRELGDPGVRGLYAVLIVATWALVYASVRLYIATPARALLLTGLCAAAAATFMTTRPLVVTNLAFAFVLFCLLKFRVTGSLVWLAALPAAFAVWANMHFGYAAGLALIPLFAAAAALERVAAIADAPAERGSLSITLALVVLLAALAALGANPYGWGVLSETFQMARANASSDVLEWLSPDFRKWPAQLFLLPIGLLFVARSLAGQRAQWLDILLPLTLAGAALYSQRHIPLASIALAPTLARAFAAWRPAAIENRLPGWFRKRLGSSAGRELGDAEHWMNLALVTCVAVAAVTLQPAASAWQERRLRTLLPADAADFVLAHDLQGPMLNDYHTGGYLIDRLHPRIPVFVDGRYIPFVGEPLRDLDTMLMLRAGWQGLLDKYDIRLAILSYPAHGLPAAMSESGKYRLVYADKGFGVLIRNDVSRPDLPSVAATGTAAAEGETTRR